MVAMKKKQRRKLDAAKDGTATPSASVSGSEKGNPKVKLQDDVKSADAITPVGQGIGAPPAGSENEVGSAEGRKKRPRSGSQEGSVKVESGSTEDKDQLVAAIEEHDCFFSSVLNMIPEHLVLRAKEVPEAAYASKYIKVGLVVLDVMLVRIVVKRLQRRELLMWGRTSSEVEILGPTQLKTLSLRVSGRKQHGRVACRYYVLVAGGTSAHEY